MSDTTISPPFLRPDKCRDMQSLRSFVTHHIGANAWPIHSRVLRRRIQKVGLDLGLVHSFTLNRTELMRLMQFMYRACRRAEALTSSHNAFHGALHNFEVLVRLLVLEWPEHIPMPIAVRQAPLQAYMNFDRVAPVVMQLVETLKQVGVSDASIARAALAALGHDYGHTGGTDRTDASGQVLPLTHEEMAERHVAGFGLRFGFPPALVLQSMAGIRATTFHHRAGRERIQAVNAFERRLTLADVMGCALPPDQWLTHVATPVLLEKLPLWKRRTAEIHREMRALEAQALASPHDSRACAALALKKEALCTERASFVVDLDEWFRSERGFFVVIGSQKLEAVSGARALWGAVVEEKIALADAILSQTHLLEPLQRLGPNFLEIFANQLSNTPSLQDRLQQDDVDPRLRELLWPLVRRAAEEH